jgi:hypothetical protein
MSGSRQRHTAESLPPAVRAYKRQMLWTQNPSHLHTELAFLNLVAPSPEDDEVLSGRPPRQSFGQPFGYLDDLFQLPQTLDQLDSIPPFADGDTSSTALSPNKSPSRKTSVLSPAVQPPTSDPKTRPVGLASMRQAELRRRSGSRASDTRQGEKRKRTSSRETSSPPAEKYSSGSTGAIDTPAPAPKPKTRKKPRERIDRPKKDVSEIARVRRMKNECKLLKQPSLNTMPRETPC